ncbi:MAG: bi-domain-containing oxidoreductase [Pyrinomonadaceae bacterium]
MFQVIQDVRSGQTGVREIPDPIALPSQVVVRIVASLVSAGTERYVVDLARKSVFGKARERPDHVRRVMQKIKQEGFRPTMSQVFAKLDEPMPLGYSSAGIVLECGRGVQEFKPGDRVATAGPHAGVIGVGRNLCARIPDGVSFEQAAYTSVASIALEGIRLARVTLGERVLVVGLGLVGQISVCLLKAQGCRVFGTDIDPKKLELARALGADEVGTGAPIEAVRAFSDSFGVDAAIITAATASNEPIEFAAEACRTKGRIVLVGVAGLNLPRDPFFRKELEFTVSSSLGPGRGDPSYEEKGIDYPIGHARWTAQRNMQTVLETMANGQLPVERLTTHRFAIGNAARAYDLITSRREPFTGILIEYPLDAAKSTRKILLRAKKSAAGKLGVSMIGAGNFARLIMFPILSKLSDIEWRGLCTARGMNAEHSGRKMDFAFATTDVAEIFHDESTSVVFIATRHDLHAELVIAALRAGKHVFVEKPLCITRDELNDISDCVGELGADAPLLMVGFNRRFAPGPLPVDAWPQDEDIGGGRIVGEACHAIDTCLALTGGVPTKVYSESVGHSGGIETTDDRVFITMRHTDGSISNVSYQAGGDRAAPTERIEVYGGGRTGVVDSWNDVELWSNNKLVRARTGNDKGHRAELQTFIRACRTGGDWPIDWQQIYGTAWASLAAVASLREGLPIERGVDGW